MKANYEGYRALLVHAHPDDETINNGATMALYANLGAKITLVTCTRGEEGEVLVEDLAHIAAAHNDQLGEHRVEETVRCEATEIVEQPHVEIAAVHDEVLFREHLGQDRHEWCLI